MKPLPANGGGFLSFEERLDVLYCYRVRSGASLLPTGDFDLLPLTVIWLYLPEIPAVYGDIGTLADATDR